MELRPHQKIVYDKIVDKIRLGHKRILVSAPTGFGKTALSYVISKNANTKGNRVLFTNHRIALANQTKDAFIDLNPEFLQGDNKISNPEALLIIATIQTLFKTEIGQPKIIIIDEIHYAYNSDLIQSVFQRWPGSVFIGLSATPVDDKDFLLNGFDSIIDDYQTEDLIKLGYLTPFKCFVPFTFDTSQVKLVNDEFSNKELEKAINKIDINESVVGQYIQLGENRPFICFATNTNHCIDLKDTFTKYGVLVEIISAKTSDTKRDEYIEQLRTKKIKGLISIEILTAGFNEPSVSCIIMATATMQWKKYIQSVGRGIRLIGNSIDESIKNNKPNCYLLDFGGNIERHGMPEDRKVFKFGKKISRVIDSILEIDEDLDKRKSVIHNLTEERQVYLQKIGGLIDLYADKIYSKEQDLLDDCRTILKRGGYNSWRQNSGKANIEKRWVQFTDKAGLPDITLIYKSVYIGLELKLPKGALTPSQKITLSEFVDNKIIFFIIESVIDLFEVLEIIIKNITQTDTSLVINKYIYILNETQQKYRRKYKIHDYDN